MPLLDRLLPIKNLNKVMEAKSITTPPSNPLPFKSQGETVFASDVELLIAISVLNLLGDRHFNLCLHS